MKLRHLDDLAAFVRVMDVRSFSAAARELHLSPKTVSKQMGRLEKALGVTLFERNTRHLRVTDEGRAIAEHVRRVLGLMDEIESMATGTQCALQGTIRMTAPVPFGRRFVAPAIQDFRQLHPGVRFDLRLSDQVQDLFGSDLDLAIRMGPLVDSRLVARHLTTARRILVASPGYLARHGEPSMPADLSDHACLVFAYPGTLYNRWQLRSRGQEAVITVNAASCSDNGDVLNDWCVAGMGIALRECWDVHEDLEAGRLRRVLRGWEAASLGVSLVRVQRHPVPKRLSAFSDFLVARCSHFSSAGVGPDPEALPGQHFFDTVAIQPQPGPRNPNP